MPDHAAWDRFCLVVGERSHLDLSSYSPTQLLPRILAMLGPCGCASLDELAFWLTANDSNLRWFVDAMNINVSEMFRDQDKWTELAEVVLPMLNAGSQALRVWSAGCSFGAEPLTLAMILDAKFRGEHQILATDIDSAALERARSGELTDDEVRAVPAEFRRTYLTKSVTGWTAHHVIRKYINFQRGDLLTSRYPSDLDLIVCRNVAIYLTEQAQRKLYQRFAASLQSGGVLFVGATEAVPIHDQIGLELISNGFYRRVADRSVRKAS